jgi:uncharacterized protein YodC (DUF2158 family)
MAIQLKPGTVVQLKSGGPKMTVVREEVRFEKPTGNVVCEWFAGNDHKTHAFAESSLNADER